MMTRVEFGRVWEINTVEDFNKAMETLEDNKFIANMSDDFRCWAREMAEVDKQMSAVKRMAREKGIM